MYPPYHAYHGEYTSTRPVRNSSHQPYSRYSVVSGPTAISRSGRRTGSTRPGAKNSSPLPNESSSDSRPKKNG